MGSTHIDTAFMGLTSSGGVTVQCNISETGEAGRSGERGPSGEDQGQSRDGLRVVRSPRFRGRKPLGGKKVVIFDPFFSVERGFSVKREVD
jgi:hypothetical protein